MPLLCRLLGHQAQSRHSHNCALDFTLCHHCGCYLIRPDGGEWIEVPHGYRVVWRSSTHNDAAAVARKMEHPIGAAVKRVHRGADFGVRRLPRTTWRTAAASAIITFRALAEWNYLAPDVAEGLCRQPELPAPPVRLPYRPIGR